jgi:hypothetical protein
MFDVLMGKVKAFFSWVLGMGKGLLGRVLGLPKKVLCWLHSKFCGC